VASSVSQPSFYSFGSCLRNAGLVWTTTNSMATSIQTASLGPMEVSISAAQRLLHTTTTQLVCLLPMGDPKCASKTTLAQMGRYFAAQGRRRQLRLHTLNLRLIRPLLRESTEMPPRTARSLARIVVIVMDDPRPRLSSLRSALLTALEEGRAHKTGDILPLVLRYPRPRSPTSRRVLQVLQAPLESYLLPRSARRSG